MGRLDGKVAVVIGVKVEEGGPGNGSAAAILFAREGARVVVASRNPEGVASTIAEIEKEGGQAVGMTGDFSTPQASEDLMKLAGDTYGRVDIVLNNIGISTRGNIETVTEEEWDYVWKSNVSSIMWSLKAALPYFRKVGGGSVINTSSIASVKPRGTFSYTVTKAAELSMTEALASDYGPEGVRVNAIMLGLVASPLAMKALSAIRSERAMASALQVEGTVWDFAYACLFLASDESKWISGVTLPVDGGYLISGRLENQITINA